jgi:hypothetical protein
MSWRITPSFTQWTPALLTTALWLDAADASTVTTVSGLVSQWNDKSGNNRHFTQATPANRPTYNLTHVNNKPAVQKIQGTSDDIGLITASLGIAADAPRTTVFVFKHINISASNNELWGSNTVFMIDVGSSFQGSNTWRIRNASNNFLGTAGANTAGDKIMLIRGSNTFTDYRQSGGADSGVLAGNAHAWDTTAGVQMFNVNLTSNQSRNYRGGAVGEWIVIPEVVSNAIAEKLEGYLAHKWGLTANLPSDHPYKVNPPAP